MTSTAAHKMWVTRSERQLRHIGQRLEERDRMTRSKATPRRACMDCKGPVVKDTAVRCYACDQARRIGTPRYCEQCGTQLHGGRTRYCTKACYDLNRSPVPLRDRILANIAVDASGCWVWQRPLSTYGYGTVSIKNRPVHAHRVAYVEMVGPIPDGLELDHLCRNRACVNPAHLEPVTRTQNLLRGNGAPARNARKTHCIHGHEFTPENTRLNHLGHRRCIACSQIRSREYEARRMRPRRRKRAS